MTHAAPPSEPAIEPDMPIIDPHLHHWFIPDIPGNLIEAHSFLLEDTARTVQESGHAITHTVFVECYTMYRTDGPDAYRSLGETEFATGVAAMSASGMFGPTRFAHRIVGHVDLMLGDELQPVLDAHCAAAGGRFVGVRNNTSYSPHGLFGGPADPAAEHRPRTAAFLDGARQLGARGLSLDIWRTHDQLADVVALADALPDLVIILDHIGTPQVGGAPQWNDPESFAAWRAAIAELALRPNVRMKIGGMGMDISRPIVASTGPATSQQLAALWAPYVESCIELFGPRRAMFESNFPVDRVTASYGAIWNCFKLLTASFSAEERDWLFRRTAAETYHIAIGDEA